MKQITFMCDMLRNKRKENSTLVQPTPAQLREALRNNLAASGLLVNFERDTSSDSSASLRS